MPRKFYLFERARNSQCANETEGENKDHVIQVDYSQENLGRTWFIHRKYVTRTVYMCAATELACSADKRRQNSVFGGGS